MCHKYQSQEAGNTFITTGGNQSFTSRRHKGHDSANATRNNTNANDHTTIAKASIASSEYHTMEAFGRALGTQARLGVGTTYSTSSGM
jgi:hypothetical protein